MVQYCYEVLKFVKIYLQKKPDRFAVLYETGLVFFTKLSLIYLYCHILS